MIKIIKKIKKHKTHKINFFSINKILMAHSREFLENYFNEITADSERQRRFLLLTRKIDKVYKNITLISIIIRYI